MQGKHCVVSICDGLYYNVQLETIKSVGNAWVYMKEGQSKMCHENQLENTIATMLRGPSILDLAKEKNSGKNL